MQVWDRLRKEATRELDEEFNRKLDRQNERLSMGIRNAGEWVGERMTNGPESGNINTSGSVGAEYVSKQLDRYIADPKELGKTTPKEKYDDFVAHYVDVKPLGDGSLAGLQFSDGGGFRANDEKDGNIMYHPENRSHHDGAYYKISGKGIGRKRYDMDGNPKK